jgi:hypothetical protein
MWKLKCTSQEWSLWVWNAFICLVISTIGWSWGTQGCASGFCRTRGSSGPTELLSGVGELLCCVELVAVKLQGLQLGVSDGCPHRWPDHTVVYISPLTANRWVDGGYRAADRNGPIMKHLEEAGFALVLCWSYYYLATGSNSATVVRDDDYFW